MTKSTARNWSLVASMGPDLEVHRLRVRLAALEVDELDAFRSWFGQVLAALDTAEHRDAAATAFENAYDPQDVRPWAAPRLACPVDFLELRTTIVALGEDVWRVVVATPELVPGGWPTGLGREVGDAISTVLHGALVKSARA